MAPHPATGVGGSKKSASALRWSLEERMKNVTEKAGKLSVLRGVDVCVLVALPPSHHSSPGASVLEYWPLDTSRVLSILHRYVNSDKAARGRKQKKDAGVGSHPSARGQKGREMGDVGSCVSAGGRKGVKKGKIGIHSASSAHSLLRAPSSEGFYSAMTDASIPVLRGDGPSCSSFKSTIGGLEPAFIDDPEGSGFSKNRFTEGQTVPEWQEETCQKLTLQQQFHQQQRQQQCVCWHPRRTPPQCLMNEKSCLEVTQVSDFNRLFQPHFSVDQWPIEVLLPFVSQNVHALPPQIFQLSYPKVEQNLLSSLPKAGMPLQLTSLNFVVPSPSTSLAESPLNGDCEKQESSTSATYVGSIGCREECVDPTGTQSLATSPCISPLQMLAGHIDSHGGQESNLTVSSCESNATERPIEHLVKTVKSLPSEILRSSLRDIASVICTIDMIAEPSPYVVSHDVISEDLSSMTKFQLQARNFMSQDE